MSHSPLPWRVDTPNCPDDVHWHAVGCANSMTIADMNRDASLSGEPNGDDLALANAEFIVLACNSHADLLAALKAVADCHYAWCGFDMGYGSGKVRPDELEAARQQVLAAIAKAENR